MGGCDVDVMIEDDAWAATDLSSWAQLASDATLGFLGMAPEDWSIVILACGDARISELNAEFRDKPTPTNVLSWPSHERDVPLQDLPFPTYKSDDPELGDIAISYGVTAREALEQGKTLEAHAMHLIVHAVLHLLGYDHIDDKDAAQMEGVEREILATLGLPDPY